MLGTVVLMTGASLIRINMTKSWRKKHPEKNGGGQEKKGNIAAVEHEGPPETETETPAPKRERNVNAVGIENNPTDCNANAG
jgi:hypothetical protein